MTEPASYKSGVVFTLGHSTRSLEDLTCVLRAHGIGTLADVRRFPRSRSNPQFNQDVLAGWLPTEGFRYIWLASLGGRRHSASLSAATAGWRNASFRAFAEYMQTDEFELAIAELRGLAGEGPLAIMCAETLPWRCHRSLIADALMARGIAVVHILNGRDAYPHRLTSFARIEGGKVTYPALA